MGGLLSPPPAALVRVELAVGFVAVEEVVPGRRAAVVVVPVAGFLAAVALPAGLGPLAETGFLTGGVAAAGAAGEGDWGFSAGASSCWTTSKPSASDMLACGRASSQVQRDGLDGTVSYLVMEQTVSRVADVQAGAWPGEPLRRRPALAKLMAKLITLGVEGREPAATEMEACSHVPAVPGAQGPSGTE